MRLLTGHEILSSDAAIIYELRCSVLHGYGLPRPPRRSAELWSCPTP
jgi:hypothetical protein